MQQQKIWNTFWAEYKNNIRDNIEIKEYHTDLKQVIEKYEGKNDIIEMGCGTGITSLILDEKFNRTLLDYDEEIINFVKQLFVDKKQNATFITEDLFQNSLSDKSFDVVFNSGLMEHYNQSERFLAFKEFKRVLKYDGRIIIAVPNHYCLPYRLGYLLLNFLHKWPYPKEYKIKNFDNELKDLNLEVEEIIICSKSILKDNIGNKFIRKLYEFTDSVFKFEGYLRVFIIKKSDA